MLMNISQLAINVWTSTGNFLSFFMQQWLAGESPQKFYPGITYYYNCILINFILLTIAKLYIFFHQTSILNMKKRMIIC